MLDERKGVDDRCNITVFGNPGALRLWLYRLLQRASTSFYLLEIMFNHGHLMDSIPCISSNGTYGQLMAYIRIRVSTN